MLLCSACRKPIIDKYACQIQRDDRVFHWSCLKCGHCGSVLDHNCYVKDGHILCRQDYLRICGNQPTYSCQGCCKYINNKQDLVIKIPSISNKSPSNTPNSSNGTSYVLYHLKCIRCSYCNRELNPGDSYVLNKMNQSLVCTSNSCISHYNSSYSSAVSSTVSSSYASSMPPSPLQQPPPPQHNNTNNNNNNNNANAKMSVPSGRGRRGRGGGMYKKQ